MPTIVGILTFISMINTTSERLKAAKHRTSEFSCQYFSFHEQLKSCSVELSMKKVFITSEQGFPTKGDNSVSPSDHNFNKLSHWLRSYVKF